MFPKVEDIPMVDEDQWFRRLVHFDAQGCALGVEMLASRPQEGKVRFVEEFMVAKLDNDRLSRWLSACRQSLETLCSMESLGEGWWQVGDGSVSVWSCLEQDCDEHFRLLSP